MKKWILITVNLLILVLGIVFSTRYSEKIQDEQLQASKEAFSATISSMENVSVVHLYNQQEYVNNWANYINSKQFTMEQALEELCNINTNNSASAHIIDPDTMQGYSTTANVTDANDHSVNYSAMSESIRQKNLFYCV